MIKASITGQEAVARLRSAGLLARAVGGQVRAAELPSVTSDSRKVTAGGVFVAIEGSAEDGHDYIPQAIAAGAAMLVVGENRAREVDTETAAGDPPVLEVSSTRRALAILASAIHGDPAQDLAVSGVTGTNGKTTTAWILAQVLAHAGIPAGYVGTLGYGIPGDLRPSAHTTPDPSVLHEVLSEMRANGCRAAVLEASSHAIDQDRIAAIPFRAAVFTNLTRDHLDYHGTPEAYRDAKAALFRSLEEDALAVVNLDDPAGRYMADASAAPVRTFGRGPEADVRYAIRADRADGLRLRIDGQDAAFRLSGAFNAANLAAAYAAMEAYGLPAAERLEALQEAKPAPGRFEALAIGKDRVAVVDYAHTPDALENVLQAARAMAPAGANLWCVFGCGGDRDRGKRPLMGAIAERLADRVVVTSDNPRTEDPEAIMEDIREGMAHPERAHWVVERGPAIARAVRSSGAGDVIVVAGKGPEPYQIIGTESFPFLDADAIRQAAEG